MTTVGPLLQPEPLRRRLCTAAHNAKIRGQSDGSIQLFTEDEFVHHPPSAGGPITDRRKAPWVAPVGPSNQISDRTKDDARCTQ